MSKYLIIIPTFNEASNIGPLIDLIFKTIPEISVCVVDDKSPDGTSQVVSEISAQYPTLSLITREGKNGLGQAYIHGFREALKDPGIERIIMMDADFSHDPKYLPAIIKESYEHGLVIGSRYVSGGGISHWELWRQLLSRWANFYIGFIFQKRVHDWTGGFNCIDTKFLARINLSEIDLSGYAFISELKYILAMAGAKVKEVPIVFEARRGGESKISGFIIKEAVFAPWKLRRRFFKNSRYFLKS